MSETDYCGTVNVLDAADTDWDAKCRVNESLYAQRVSDFSYKVHVPRCINICFTILIILFLLIKVYKYIFYTYLSSIFDALMWFRSIYALERLTSIIRKQIVSDHCINYSIDLNTYLSNILIIFLFQLYRWLHVYKISYMTGVNLPLYSMSSVKDKV